MSGIDESSAPIRGLAHFAARLTMYLEDASVIIHRMDYHGNIRVKLFTIFYIIYWQEPELARRVTGIYTYGQPRVGDDDFMHRFCSTYGGCAYRIRTAADIVPFLLPRWLGYRYGL